ncbi:MAG: orotate phosphoribosyltransferase [Phenylobacterium sp.]|uniref:orotate phosphoribosyltransferase n=1 Tax=Phenylobacterium sp. TaxID=1871053 RepID=UPI002727CD8F|nr:orotate phosphoribosyltransferase [Phenylobacterium sp.]MDO8411281.1 orotate phosphoribosyltransferase [Phenylobacterium sp.]
MTTDEVLEEFRGAGALREGHFVLSSGLHSGMFLQKNLVFQYPDRTERLCKALADLIRREVGQVDVCVSPAVGGIIPGYETARQLGVPSMYVERVDGRLQFRRAFALKPGARVAMVEDIVSTGLSSRECVEAIREAGGEVVCAAALVDRSGGRAEIGAPFLTLAKLDVPAYPADQLPPELAAIPVEDPGSRRLNR